MKLVQHDHCKDSSFVYTADGCSVYLSRPFAVAWLTKVLGGSGALIRQAVVADTRCYEVKHAFYAVRLWCSA